MRLQREKQGRHRATVRFIGWAVSFLFLAYLVPDNALAEEYFGEGVEIEVVFQTIHRTDPQELRDRDTDGSLPSRTVVPQASCDVRVFRDEAVVWKSGNRDFINGCGAVLRL